MEKLLQMAKKVCDQAEVYSVQSETSTVYFQNAKLNNIEQAIQSGVTLRIIKDGKLGFSYTKNLKNRDNLIQNARNALNGGAEAPASFANTPAVPSLDTFDPASESTTSETLANECRRVGDLLQEKSAGQLMATTTFTQTQTRILNSLGADLQSRCSEYVFNPMLLFPGSFANISRGFTGKTFCEIPDESIEHIVALFNAAEKEARPKGGNMPVLFLPETVTTLLMRIVAGTNAQMIFHKQSPLGDKIGEKILDSKLTVQDTPLADAHPGARAFDDEGTPCEPMSLVKNGILENIFTDRLYAGKLGINPTGHGYKMGYAGDPISFKPAPALQHLMVEPGDQSLSEMIASMDSGIIVAGDLGGHTGNIPAGDFSVGLSPGLYVQGGKIVGHVKDAMVAGNVYETLNNIVAVENRRHGAGAPLGGLGIWRCPAVLVDDVSVATKQS